MDANNNFNFSLLKMKKTGGTTVWLSTINLSDEHYIEFMLSTFKPLQWLDMPYISSWSGFSPPELYKCNPVSASRCSHQQDAESKMRQLG